MNASYSRKSWRKRGSALIAVIWAIAVLSLAVMAAVRVVDFDLDIVASQSHGFRAAQFAEAGIAIAANPQVPKDDPLLRQMNGESGDGFEARIVSEGARFNINAILLREDKKLLQSMFNDWGLDLDAAQDVTDALSDWIDDNDTVELNGAEKDWYEGQGRVNQPFNRPFYSLEEVRLVRGMDLVEKVKPDWRDWFTIWSSGALDYREAAPELIAAAADVNIQDAEALVETIRGPDGIVGTEDDRNVPKDEALAILGVPEMMRAVVGARLTNSDTTTRLESIGHSAGAKKKITLVVRNRTGRPAILDRTEETIP